MLVPCLAMVTSPTEQQPPPTALVNQLLATTSWPTPSAASTGGAAPGGQPWLDMLYVGTSKSTKQLPHLHIGLEDMRQEAGSSSSSYGSSDAAITSTTNNPTSSSSSGDISNDTNSVPPTATATTTTASSSSSSSSSSSPPKLTGRAGFTIKRKQTGPQQKLGSKGSTKAAAAAAKATEKHLKKIVAFNAYGEPHSDYAVARLLQQGTGGFVGLWPEFAMLNHSCAPNTIHWVLRHHMVVRAVKGIAAGKSGE